MAIRVGINGFGRMGRLALRAGWESPELEFVQINELRGDAPTAAHLLEFDSVHGRWSKDISADADAIMIDGRRLAFSNIASPAEIVWNDVDVVLECTGSFRTVATLSPHLERGARAVVVSAPVKEGVLNIVMGVNDDRFDPRTDSIVTAASCTTNCLAPVVKVLHEAVGIRHGVITTIHDMTNTQTVVDAPLKDLRRARASSLSLIPTSTGSATAITMIYPELKGRLNGLAVRVPLLNASLTDCVFEMERAVTVEEINALFKRSAEQQLRGILGYEERPLVSVDFRGDTRSAIVDAASTMVVDGTQLKVLAWYDNEMGYVCRMVELAAKVGRAIARQDGFRDCGTHRFADAHRE